MRDGGQIFGGIGDDETGIETTGGTRDRFGDQASSVGRPTLATIRRQSGCCCLRNPVQRSARHSRIVGTSSSRRRHEAVPLSAIHAMHPFFHPIDSWRAPAIFPGKLAAPLQNGDTCVRFRRLGLTKRFDSRSLRRDLAKRFVRHSRSVVERRESVRERSNAHHCGDSRHRQRPARGRWRLQSCERPQLTRQGQGRRL